MRIDERTMSKRHDASAMQTSSNRAILSTTGQRNSTISQNSTSASSLIKGVAGMGSGAISSVACAPLDLIRTRMQVMGGLDGNGSKQLHSRKGMLCTLKDVIAQDGFKGCFRGLGASLATVPMFWGIYFPMYEIMKSQIYEWQENQQERGSINGDTNASLRHMASAIVAGCFADVVCNPMFVVRTRMQTESLHITQLSNSLKKTNLPQLTIRGTISSLYREGGIPIFWRGLTASLMGLSHVAIQMPVYEWCKKEASARRAYNNNHEAVDILISSAVSKICACVITYPHEVIRSRMMDSRVSSSLIGTFKTIVQTEGYSSLYSGLHISLARVVPNCCVTFISYEYLLKWMLHNK